MSDAAEISAEAGHQRMALVVAASALGTVFEWYDFFIFGSLTTIIAAHFFAGVSEAQGLIFALLTFAAGFAVRPFGALVFGRIGDRSGRKRAFLVTMIIMGLATVAVGLIPDYKAIGIAAPFVLVSLRVLQGFAIGGQYGGAVTYVAEHAEARHRGAATGWIQVAAPMGLVLALTIILLCRTNLGEAAFKNWAWRLPFIFSAALLALSIYIRLKLSESPMYQRIQAAGKSSRAPITEAFLRWTNLRVVLTALFGLLTGQGVVWYAAMFYTQFFLEGVIKAPPTIVNFLILPAVMAAALLHIFFAWLSDFTGRKPVMLFGLGLATLSFLPGFQMLAGAVNPALVSAAQHVPVTVIAAPADCSLQFDLIGKKKFLSSCDVAKNALASLGIPYRNEAASPGSVALVQIGSGDAAVMPTVTMPGPDGRGVAANEFAQTKKQFVATLKTSLARAGYPAAANVHTIDVPRALALLLVFMVAASALYGPQAATLVELFPTRIRYTALSFPYHVGVGWFGGFLPVTAYAIVVATGNIYAGLWYPVIVAGVGFVVTLFFLPETRNRDIEA
jgi:MFS family permease